MSTQLGCIADDFTGATDLAGLLARSGRKVSAVSQPCHTAAQKVSANASSGAS